MKRYFLPALFLLATGAVSCNNSESGTSTPIDSTVQSGTAPVDYQAGASEPTIDTTMQTRDQYQADTAGLAPGAPGGPMPSNTTDRRATSGSAAGTSNNPPVK